MDLICADFGSTFTKVTVVTPNGALLSTGSSSTTIDTDVMDGLDAALTDAGVESQATTKSIYACSSAGGGLRLAVVGYERSITAEAGYRVGLSAGARVVHVAAGFLDPPDVEALLADRPDVVLLSGGTDGGNTEALLANARQLAKARLNVPVIVAGNAGAQEKVLRIARRGGVPVSATANVLPKIGVLDPVHAREAIREAFISHVIGGKHLSTRTDLSTFVRAATPDAVLAGVELLSDGVPGRPGVGDVVVIDVGGATTDVYSVITPDAEQSALDREAVATLWRSRTVEGDLGVRWNAVGVVDAAVAERLIDGAEADSLYQSAQQRVANPAMVPTNDHESKVDQRLATLAATTALRRHARPHESGDVRYLGKDLRHARFVIGSGGVLRHSDPIVANRIITDAVNDRAGGWRYPENAKVRVDGRYVLAAAGLLRRDYPDVAMTLLREQLMSE